MTRIPAPGTAAGEFTLVDGDGKQVRLSDFRGKNVVLAFYPLDWSPVCTHELSLFEETLDELRSYNAEIIGISVDSKWSHRAWAQEQHITFPLLSDFWPHGAVARQYGVFRDGDGFSDRALFFIDAQGIVRDSWVAEDPDIAPGLDIVFDALTELQGGGPEAEVPHA